MKVENSFIGGCLYALGWVSIFLFFLGISEGFKIVFDLLNIQMSPIELLAYTLNGFSTEFELFKFYIFVAKVITLNMVMFYAFAYLTER